MLILLLVLLLVFGFGGYRLGGPDHGQLFAGSGLGLALLVLLILYVFGVFGPIGRIR